MHELSVALELLRRARAELAARGGARIDAVVVALGELAGVEPELLAFAWEAAVAGTPDAGARLEIRREPADASCPSCGARPEHVPGSWLHPCPICAQPLRVRGGDALDLVELAYEAPEELEAAS